ncbi:uncharacterized protein LOC664014 [Tribolium castaneum]|uniref:Protein TsetseEP domain-containing protein n=1 Tax=Tribolium castaneum TaxID=7070 RepID=D2A3C8_TRICA|nr:PREDICTED: uncharacterized protein LOC664014 [Tribolium castaneum]EFA02293.1 hypothetical protein TcasGA2_TC007957 [Tribolium castaneum]|eukprot:XP_976470.1 PREDICTED: uncharacterized protein LOC664014 [Tribolium castaneum]
MPVTSAKLLFVVFLVVQSCNTSAIDDANAALNGLRENVNNGLSDALKTGYTAMAQKIDSIIELTRSNGSEVISSTSDTYLAQYQAIKKSAEDSGLDVSSCVAIFEEKLTNLASVNINGLLDCVDTQTDPCIDYIGTSSSTLLGNFLSQVFAFEKEVLKCKDDACLTSVTGEISRTSASVLSKINYSVQVDASKMQYYESTVTTCGVKFTSIADGQGKSYVNGFQDCVNSLINKM